MSHAVDDGLLSTTDGQVASSIISLRNQWQQYLNHKEQMAYVAAIVYIGSAATVATREDLASQLHTGVGKLSAILIAIAAFVFVTWQVDRLRVATHTLAVCNELLVRSLATQSDADGIEACIGLRGYEWRVSAWRAICRAGRDSGDDHFFGVCWTRNLASVEHELARVVVRWPMETRSLGAPTIAD